MNNFNSSSNNASSSSNPNKAEEVWRDLNHYFCDLTSDDIIHVNNLLKENYCGFNDFIKVTSGDDVEV